MNARHTCRVIVQCGLLPHQVLEEGLGGEVRVVLLGQRALHVDDLEAAQLEAALLEAGNDLADESALKGLAGGWRGTKDMLESECSADGRSLSRPPPSNGHPLSSHLDAVRLDHDVAPLVIAHCERLVS